MTFGLCITFVKFNHNNNCVTLALFLIHTFGRDNGHMSVSPIITVVRDIHGSVGE